MYDALNDLFGGTLVTETFRKLQLPLQALDESKRTFGLGLYSAVATAPAAYISSITHLTGLILQKEWESIPTGDDRTRAFRASLELPGAKDWVQAPPSPALQTHVPNRLFRMWLKFYRRTPITDRTAQTCPRPK